MHPSELLMKGNSSLHLFPRTSPSFHESISSFHLLLPPLSDALVATLTPSFDVWRLSIDDTDRSTFLQLAEEVSRFILATNQPVTLMGDGFGATLAGIHFFLHTLTLHTYIHSYISPTPLCT